MVKTRTRHRPPRIFIKNGKIYVRIGKKRYLLKDQKKYSREDLIDIILKNLLVRRKRRKKGKLTRRERRLNLKDLKTFEAFEKLNRSRRGSNLVLPAGMDMSLSRSSTEQSFLNALVKFSGKVPKDINVANREISTGSANPLLLTDVAAPAPAPPPLLRDRPDTNIRNTARYNQIKSQIISEFTKKGRKKDKTAALKNLIATEGIPVRHSNPTGGTKSTENLAKDIIAYYERNNMGQNLLSVFNTYFPQGINISPPPQVPKEQEEKINIPPPPQVPKEQEEKINISADDADKFILDVFADVNLPPPESEEQVEEIKQTASGVIVRTMANKSGLDRGLSTDEIDNMMRGTQGYLGTYPADFMKFLPKKLPKVFSFVMNTDPSGKPGKHWVAVRVDTMDENAVEYYDSFAEQPSKRFMKQLKSLINKLDVPVYLKLKINKIKEQDTSTNNCGWFAMSFIINRNLGMPFRECTGYDDSVAGEGDIDKLKNKFGYV
jgi:hypothetical protein